MNKKIALTLVASIAGVALSSASAFAGAAAKAAGDKTVTTATVKSPEPPRDASLIGSHRPMGAQSVRPPKIERKE